MIWHCCISVRGALRYTDAMLKRSFGGCITVDGRVLQTGAEIRSFFEDRLAEGNEVIPYGECDNFDPKTGCKGHPSKAEKEDPNEATDL